MQPEVLVSKLIKLQEKAEIHSSHYSRLRQLPGNKTKASEHERKALRLYSRIQELIHEIATAGGKSRYSAPSRESETP